MPNILGSQRDFIYQHIHNYDKFVPHRKMIKYVYNKQCEKRGGDHTCNISLLRKRQDVGVFYASSEMI